MNVLQQNIKEHFLLLNNAYKRDGLVYMVKSGARYLVRWPIDITMVLYHSYLRGEATQFTYQGKSYGYFIHSYNTTWDNPRKVEIPIIWSIIRENKGKRILEIGNVLRHYFPYEHDVIDLYEKYIGVTNQDIIDFKPAQKYDLVVSISTFEHIGYNENESDDPSKFSRAIRNVVDNVLTERGQFIITVPLGDNPGMDKILFSRAIEFSTVSCMQQIPGTAHKWREIDWEEVASREFNSSGNWIGLNSTVLVGTISR